MNGLRGQIAENGEAIFTVTGWSMWPMMRNNTDQAIVHKPPDRLKAGDVALYERPDGMFVLHRVMKVNGGEYILCGDNQKKSAFESGIGRDNIVGILTGFYRGRSYWDVKSLPYRIYSFIWTRVYWLRIVIMALLKFTAGIVNGIRAVKTRI